MPLNRMRSARLLCRTTMVSPSRTETRGTSEVCCKCRGCKETDKRDKQDTPNGRKPMRTGGHKTIMRSFLFAKTYTARFQTPLQERKERLLPRVSVAWQKWWPVGRVSFPFVTRIRYWWGSIEYETCSHLVGRRRQAQENL